MIAFVVALMLTSPARLEPACDEQGYPVTASCRASCAWWSKAEQRCRDVDVEVIGSWDPRPLEWSNNTLTEPREWGAYETEKR